MFGLPWICRSCLTSLAKSHSRRQLRFASNATTNGAISKALLSRARLMADEHARLSKATEESFDVKSAKRIGELQGVATALKEWEDTSNSLSELQDLLHSSDKELRELAADDLASTTDDLEAVSQRLRKALTPKHPFADLPCLVEFKPGAGGSEANLFASDLLRMYRAYCARKNFRASLLKYETADDASGESALQEAILEIETPGAYGELRSEAGVHRVQRVPATESKGRTHTSAVSVIVLPSIPDMEKMNGDMDGMDFDDPESDYHVNSADVRVDVMRARGAGGQHVNTTDSAVRLTHIPTGTVVNMQESRSQQQNRTKAWQVLRSRLAQARREAREEEVASLRRSVVGVARLGRGDKVRTYNWGQQRVTDHRSGLSVHNLDDVLEGGMELEKIIESVKDWLTEREIEALIAEDEAAGKK